MQLNHFSWQNDRQIESLTMQLEAAKKHALVLDKEVMRQFKQFKDYRAQHSQVTIPWKLLQFWDGYFA